MTTAAKTAEPFRVAVLSPSAETKTHMKVAAAKAIAALARQQVPEEVAAAYGGGGKCLRALAVDTCSCEAVCRQFAAPRAR